MPKSIEDDETEAAALRLAKVTGESITGAISSAVTENCERLNRRSGADSLGARLNEIALRCSNRARSGNLSDEEILGYNPMGIPSR